MWLLLASCTDQVFRDVDVEVLMSWKASLASKRLRCLR